MVAAQDGQRRAGVELQIDGLHDQVFAAEVHALGQVEFEIVLLPRLLRGGHEDAGDVLRAQRGELRGVRRGDIGRDLRAAEGGAQRRVSAQAVGKLRLAEERLHHGLAAAADRALAAEPRRVKVAVAVKQAVQLQRGAGAVDDAGAHLAHQRPIALDAERPVVLDAAAHRGLQRPAAKHDDRAVVFNAGLACGAFPDGQRHALRHDERPDAADAGFAVQRDVGRQPRHGEPDDVVVVRLGLPLGQGGLELSRARNVHGVGVFPLGILVRLARQRRGRQKGQAEAERQRESEKAFFHGFLLLFLYIFIQTVL